MLVGSQYISIYKYMKDSLELSFFCLNNKVRPKDFIKVFK